jgi:CO dehydrogenase nickel-insertion accessory protein CooC1
LNNFSVLITGDAGSGKTQTIRVLIDAACQAGLALTIFDFKADYCDEKFARPLGIESLMSAPMASLSTRCSRRQAAPRERSPSSMYTNSPAF